MNNGDANANTLSELKDLLKLSKEWFDTYHKTVIENFNNMGFKFDIKEESLVFEYEKLRNNEYEVSTIRDFLINHAAGSFKDEYANMSEEEIRDTIGKVKEISLAYDTYEKDLADIRDDIKESISEYNETTKSKAISTKFTTIENMETLVLDPNNDMTEKEVAEIKKNIKDLKYVVNMDIIFDRYKEPYTKKEVANIVNRFIYNYDSTYAIDKFKTKIKRFGFSENAIKFFLNLEENFLDEKYAVYNNLFLYIYINMVAYADPYNKLDEMSVKSITSNIINLVYNKFDDNDREIFINQISNVLDYYKDEYDLFKEKNTTWKNHPERTMLEEHSKEISIEYYKNKLKNFGIDEELYKDINTIDGIKNFYDEHIDSKKEAEVLAYRDSQVLERSREYIVSLIKESYEKENPDTDIPSEINDLLDKPISEAILYADKALSEESKNTILEKYEEFIKDARSEIKDNKIKELEKYKNNIDNKVEEIKDEGIQTEQE